jgi:hypothetical protein
VLRFKKKVLACGTPSRLSHRRTVQQLSADVCRQVERHVTVGRAREAETFAREVEDEVSSRSGVSLAVDCGAACFWNVRAHSR